MKFIGKFLPFLLSVLLLLIIMPARSFAVHEEDISDLEQRVKALEQAKEKTIDLGGFMRFRYHMSNFNSFGAGQVLPPDKSVEGQNNAANFFEGRTRLYFTTAYGDYISGTAAFELDYRAGDSAYGVGAQAGGGLEADQINLETKNLNVTAKLPGTNLSGTFGLQNIVDPYGGLLLGWADAAGVTLNYKAASNVNTLLGFYRFWQPTAKLKNSAAADFIRGEVAYTASKELNLGFNLYALLDRTGVGGNGVLGGSPVGSTSNGFAPLSYNVSTGYESLVGNTDYTFNLALPGVNFAYKAGGFTLDGFFIYETGKFDSRTQGIDSVTVNSYAANLGASTKVGPFNLKLSGLYVSGDNSNTDPSIGIKKRGFYTPGSWSLAAAWNGLTGMKILFPDIDATNQDQYLVYDVTNTLEQKPLGVRAVMITGNAPLAKNVMFEGGLGTLSSAKDRVVNNNSYMATEVNAGVHYTPYKSFSIGVVGAYAWVGNFYTVTDQEAAAFNATKTGNPVAPNRDPADMWRIYIRTNYSF